MPVLDAKALEMDPKGTTFLKSVLRPLPASETTPKKTPRASRIRFLVSRRSRELTVSTV
jgi:hypothetical protein